MKTINYNSSYKFIKESLKDRIFKILLEDPTTRDDDRLLSIEVWEREFVAMGWKTPQMRYTDFTMAYGTEQISPVMSIERARRMLQKQYTTLRGEKWIERHQAQDNVKKELGYKI